MAKIIGYQSVPGTPGVFISQDGVAGTAYFVDSGHADASTSNSGLSWDAPLSTLASAIGKTSANSGDVIFLAPGHAETSAVTTGIAVNVAGISIIGCGVGRSRPAITAHASAIDSVTVSAANVLIENINFVNAASCTAQINVTAADLTVRNCIIQQGAAPLMGMTMAAGADRFLVENTLFVGVAAGPDVGIDLEAHLTDWTVRDCTFNYSNSDGLDLAGIRCDDKAQEGYAISNCLFIAMDLCLVDMNSSTDAQCQDGIISNCHGAMAAATANIDTAIDAGGSACIENYATDLPAEAGGRVPVATPA